VVFGILQTNTYGWGLSRVWSNLGLLTQNVQWLVLQGTFFVISFFVISVWTFWPGLFLMGFGIGTMLTASVNLVQSAWPEDVQGTSPASPTACRTCGRRWMSRSAARSSSPRQLPAA